MFASSGMEGRLFAPLGIAYIVSISVSLVVSLTVTPVLVLLAAGATSRLAWLAAVLAPCANFGIIYRLMPLLLQRMGLETMAQRWGALSPWAYAALTLATAPLTWALLVWGERMYDRAGQGLLLRTLQSLADRAIRLSLRWPLTTLAAALLAVLLSLVGLFRLERDFLPPFNEGAVQINVILPPGTSLETSQDVARAVERRLQQVADIRTFVRKTGRAELDEHAVPVNMTEIIATLDPLSSKSRAESLAEIRQALSDVPGIVTSVEQPLGHLISRMLSGVQAQIAIKLYGDDLPVLRRHAQTIQAADRHGSRHRRSAGRAADRDPPTADRNRRRPAAEDTACVATTSTSSSQTAMNGQVVSEVLLGQRTFDLLVRLDEPFREDIDAVKRLTIDLPDGGTTSLGSVAKIYRSSGPNTINREQARRRIVIQGNTSGRGLVDVVQDIKTRLKPFEESLPPGYFLEYGGQFESQQSASRVIAALFALALVGMFLVLYTMFRSANLSLQVMIALPMAFIGSVAALLPYRPDADRGGHGRFHLAVRHRLPQRNPADQPLPAPGAARRGNVVASDDRACRTRTRGPRADDRADVRHRPGTAWRWPPANRARRSSTRWPR